MRKLRIALAVVLAIPVFTVMTAAPAQACDYNPKTGCGGCYFVDRGGLLPEFECHS